jgi:hypothetical protein
MAYLFARPVFGCLKYSMYKDDKKNELDEIDRSCILQSASQFVERASERFRVLQT